MCVPPTTMKSNSAAISGTTVVLIPDGDMMDYTTWDRYGMLELFLTEDYNYEVLLPLFITGAPVYT
jgi:hypothetical protein